MHQCSEDNVEGSMLTLTKLPRRPFELDYQDPRHVYALEGEDSRSLEGILQRRRPLVPEYARIEGISYEASEHPPKTSNKAPPDQNGY